MNGSKKLIEQTDQASGLTEQSETLRTAQSLDDHPSVALTLEFSHLEFLTQFLGSCGFTSSHFLDGSSGNFLLSSQKLGCPHTALLHQRRSLQLRWLPTIQLNAFLHSPLILPLTFLPAKEQMNHVQLCFDLGDLTLVLGFCLKKCLWQSQNCLIFGSQKMRVL